LSNDKIIHARDKLGKSIVYTYLFSILSAIISFLIVVVFTWMLPPEEWGAFSIAKRTATLTATIALLGVSVAITRYIPLERARKSKYADYYGSNAIYIVACSTIVLVIIWIGGLYGLNYTGIVNDLLIVPLYASILFAIALMWQMLMTSFLRAEGFILRFNQMTVTGQLFQLLFGLLTILFFGASAYLAILGSAIGIVTVVGISFTIVVRLGITVFRKAYINYQIKSEIFAYGIPRMAMGMFDVLLVSSSLILLGFSGMTIEAGYLAIGLQIVAMLTLLFQPIAVVMLPEFSKLHGLSKNEKIESKIQLLIQGWLFVITLIFVLLYSFIDHLFPYIFKAEYENAIGMIKILLIGMIPFSFYLTIYSYINAIVKRPYLLYFLLISVIVHVIIYLIIMPVMGGSGAAIATSGGMVTLGFLVFLFLFKHQPNSFSKINVIDFVLCNAPIFLIYCLRWFVADLLIHMIITISLLSVYVFMLRVRKLDWFKIILENIKRKEIN
jgi:O-antigen/teichoic acid export membrane protein